MPPISRFALSSLFLTFPRWDAGRHRLRQPLLDPRASSGGGSRPRGAAPELSRGCRGTEGGEAGGDQCPHPSRGPQARQPKRGELVDLSSDSSEGAGGGGSDDEGSDDEIDAFDTAVFDDDYFYVPPEAGGASRSLPPPPLGPPPPGAVCLTASPLASPAPTAEDAPSSSGVGLRLEIPATWSRSPERMVARSPLPKQAGCSEAVLPARP